MPDNSNSSLGRLLVVDDEVRLMNALRDTLRDEGYEVLGVTTGAEALSALRTTPYDLLLTDLTMPEMDGIALLTAALEIDPQLVGVVITGHGTISTAVAAMKSGAFDYVLKPFKLSAILPVITRALAVRKLRRQNAELQTRITERTTDLEMANEELEAFTSSISHDLRSPLRTIGGLANVALEESGSLIPEKSQKHLQTVISMAAQMSQLVDDLLKFSRFNRQPLTKQPVVMSRLVEDVIRELRLATAGEPVQIEVGALPNCHADPALLRQVLINLLSNALKFSRGKASRTVEIGSLKETAETVYFVRDNGAGFDMRYAQKLFAIFQRMHRPEEFEGTGVGLSIVQRIVQRHGGRIWAEAEVNKGATFYFTLAAPA